MKRTNFPRGVFSGGINWDSREPRPPEDVDRTARRASRGERPRRLRKFVTHDSESAEYSYTSSSAPGHRPFSLKSVRAGRGRSVQPGLSTSQFPGSQESLKGASIQISNSSSHPEQNAVSGFGRGVLPPLSVEIDAFVVHNTAKMTVKQFFHNGSDEPISKSSYAFPLPSGCTLANFSYRIGDQKMISAVVEPAEQARKKFGDLVRDNRAAVLIEQEKEDSETIMARLGNIPGKTDIMTVFELVLLLDRRIIVSDRKDISVTTLTIPTTMASRCGGPVAEDIVAPPGMRKGLSINVMVVQSPELQDLALGSSSHDIVTRSETRIQETKSLSDLLNSTPTTKENAGSILKATFITEDGLLNRDFVLKIKSKPEAGGSKAQAWLGAHSDADYPSEQALMIHIPPVALSLASRSNLGEAASEIVFLLDQSNSMDDNIASLKDATQFLLQNIPNGWKFNIWRFGSTYTRLWSSSKGKDETNLDEALLWLQQKCQGDMGGSEIINALKAVLKHVSSPTQVVLLTDGQVWRLDQTLDLIKNTRRDSQHEIRFFCLGLVDKSSRALVDGIARSGGGYSDVIYLNDQEWGEKLVALLASVIGVYMKPVRVLLNGRHPPKPALQSPGILSRLNAFRAASIFLLVDPQYGQDIKSVTVIFAAEDGEEMEIDIPVCEMDKLDKNNTIIHKIAARALLDDLEQGTSNIHIQPSGIDREKLIKERAEEIARGWKLLSKWTSFIVPDQKDGDGLHGRPTSGSALMQQRMITSMRNSGNRLIEDDIEIEKGSTSELSSILSSEPVRGVRRREMARAQRELLTKGRLSTAAKATESTAARATLDYDRDRMKRAVGRVRLKPSDIAAEQAERLKARMEPSQQRDKEHPVSAMGHDATHYYREEGDYYQSGANTRRPSLNKRRSTRQEVDRMRMPPPPRPSTMRHGPTSSFAPPAPKRRLIDGFGTLSDHESLGDSDSVYQDGQHTRDHLQREEQRARRKGERLAEERAKFEEGRRAIEEELRAKKETETHKDYQKRFEELTKMITELALRFREKDAEDREAARKEAEERAIREDEAQKRIRREYEARRRADLERERRAREGESREPPAPDAERGRAQTTAEVAQHLGRTRPVEEQADQTTQQTPQMGQPADAGSGRIQKVGGERIWRLAVLIQDNMERLEISGAPAVARVDRLLSGDEPRGSSALPILALVTVVGMILFAMTYLFFIISTFMFLSSWMIALCILRR